MAQHRYIPTTTGIGDPRIPISAVLNENWRGKNDPAERRRIQNRLNQRAFRQRQRAGESPKQYKARSMSGSSASPTPYQDDDDEDDENDSSEDEDEDDSDEEDDDDDEEAKPKTSEESSDEKPRRPLVGSRTTSARTAPQPVAAGLVPTQGRGWDELAQVIHRNFLTAAVTNAHHLGIDQRALRDGTLIYTPRPTGNAIPASLTPVQLQYQVAHDPIIDIIPHARLRYNILCAIATEQLDAATFVRCVRLSGSQQELQGSYQRNGLVVWSSPDQISSWELTEGFIRRYAALLTGCEDLIAATNAWRSRRGERAFALATRSE